MGAKEAWGAALAVVAAIISNIGTNVQKASHLHEDTLPEHERTPYIKRKTWWIGMVLTVTASLMDFVALGLASQSLVAALGGGSTLLANVVVASCYNHDIIYFTDAVGVTFIIAGAVYFACTAKDKPKHLDYEDQFLKTSFQVYLAVQLLIVIALLSTIVGSYWYSLRDQVNEYFTEASPKGTELEKNDWFEGDPTDEQVAHVADAAEALSGGPQEGVRAYRKIDKFIYASCAGCIGGMSVLFGSITSSIMQHGGLSDAFTAWLFYISVVLMIVCVVTQTHLLNRAMELGDTTAVFPVFEAFWISFGVLGGLFFYNTSDVSWADEFKQGAGCSFMLVGCFCLLLHQETLRPSVEALQERVRSASINVSSRVRRLSEVIVGTPTNSRATSRANSRAGSRTHSRSNSESHDSSLWSIFPKEDQMQDAYGATNATTAIVKPTPALRSPLEKLTTTIDTVPVGSGMVSTSALT